MKNINPPLYVLAITLLFLLNGCAKPLQASKGMTLSEVNQASVLSVQGNLVSLGKLIELPQYDVYETEDQNFFRTWEKKHGRKSEIFTIAPEKTQFYLFYQNKLQMVLSQPQLDQFIRDSKIAEQQMITAANRAAQKKKEKDIKEAQNQRIIAAEKAKKKRIEKNIRPTLNTD